MPDIPEARPASTVVLLRDSDEGLQALMLRRNKALLFAGGLWVFPGGALDEADLEAAGGDPLRASRLAAAREAEEESGLQPRLEDMVLLSHWTTPVVEPKRFSTWIYAAPLLRDAAVVIDGGEIHDHRWLTIRQALSEHEAGALNLMPPTWITLHSLAPYGSVADLIARERMTAVPEVLPVFASGVERITLLFAGDAGYDSGDGTAPGARHRAELADGRWVYHYRGVDPRWPPLMGA